MNGAQTLKLYKVMEQRFKDVIDRQRAHESEQQQSVVEGLEDAEYHAPNGKRKRVFFKLPELGKWLFQAETTSTRVKRLIDKYLPFGVVETEKNNNYRIPHDEAMRIAIEIGERQRYNRLNGQKMQRWLVNTLKGGSGKTTTCINIAAALATETKTTYRVAVIDLDPQGNATSLLHPAFDSENDFSVGDIMMNKFALDEGETYQEFVKSCFVETNVPNLKVLPAKELDNLYPLWAQQQDEVLERHLVLEPILEAVEDEFDLVFIDTPPTINDAVISAHWSADSVIMPLRPQQNDRDGTYKYLRTFSKVYESLCNLGHKGYEHVKVIAADVTKNSASDQEMLRTIQHAAGSLLLPEFFHSEAVKKCSFKGKTVFEISESEYSMKVDGKTLYGTKDSLASAQDNVRTIANSLELDIQRSWQQL